MIRMFARRLHHSQVNAGTDRVVLGMTLPSGSRLNNLSAEVHLMGSTRLTPRRVCMYGLEMWILPLLDPDAGSNFDTIWDQLVPKDTDVETVDLDTGATDAAPFMEPGEPDFTGLLNVGLQPEKVWSRYRLLSMVSGSMHSAFDTQSPYNLEWQPGELIRIKTRKRYFIEQPSVLVLGIAAPDLDDTTATAQAAATEPELVQTKFIGHVLERAFMHLFGLVEAGAETPWEEATSLLKKHLEPDVFEETAGDMASMNYNVVARGTIDHSVEGRLADMTVSTGR